MAWETSNGTLSFSWYSDIFGPYGGRIRPKQEQNIKIEINDSVGKAGEPGE
jgi:hypothetical protein